MKDRVDSHQPPGPKGLPLLGNLVDIGRDVLRYYDEWSRQYGDMVALRLAAWPAILLNNPEYIDYVLVKNHHNFIKFPSSFVMCERSSGKGCSRARVSAGNVNDA